MNARSVKLGLAGLLGALFMSVVHPASAAECAGTCTTGTAALSGSIQTKLATEIDSGWMDKGKIKVRTRFTIDPMKGEPLLSVDMPNGAVVEASWPEKGSITLKPVTAQGAQGTMNVHYTLTPSLEASIYGLNVAYNANDLVNKIPGSAFNYDAKTTGALAPWGFQGGLAESAMPALDQSTIFSLPFSELGVDSGLVEGTLSVQAAAKPTFKYTTKSVQFDSSEAVTTPEGVTKIPAGDADALDVMANISGELALDGDLDIRPVVKIDTVDGFPTFGLVKYSFSAVRKSFGGGAPTPVSFQRAMIHIPLPNVKVPSTPVGLGTGSARKTISIDSTGEMGAILRFESSDPQFSVPSGEVRVSSKSKYELEVAFNPSSSAPATATITVHSNDPDSPEQTFKVGGNGASLGDESSDPSGGHGGNEALGSDGCSVSGALGADRSKATVGVIGVALLALGVGVSRRRRGRAL